MSKTKIEWCDYTINPVKGLCPMACSYCYARRMYKRFGWNPDIQWDEQCLIDLKRIKKPSRIFVGSTMELFGDWIGNTAIEEIFAHLRDFKQHTFIFLTKKPANLAKYSPFPSNVWVGTSIPRYWDNSVVGHPEAFKRISQLGEVKASVKFVSFEPLLESIASNFEFGLDMAFKAYGINWVIIGQQTPPSKKTEPKLEWVREIVEAADKATIPVFLKDNLESIFYYPLPEWAEDKILNARLRQEFPNE